MANSAVAAPGSERRAARREATAACASDHATLSAAAGSSSGGGNNNSHHHHHHSNGGPSAHPQVSSSTGCSSSSTNGGNTGSLAMAYKREMYDSFQTWALKTYGDSAKTKTVTRKKYNRIGKILKGEEQNNAENSKFRFWVKAKGFRMGPPPGHPNEGKHGEHVLYVPCAQVKQSPDAKEEVVYKKVAVVENFFDIIYNVHVEMDGRGGKHAGQKRTYKAIAETYAFLPREAVTKFLMQCSDCQKRMHAGAEVQNGATSPTDSRTTDSVCSEPPEIDFSLPITTTYLKHLRSLGYSEEEVLNMDHEDGFSNEDPGSSREPSPPLVDEEMSPYSGKEEEVKASSVAVGAASPLLTTRLTSEHAYDRPLDMTKMEGSCHERTATPEDLSGCIKEEDDDEDDEVDEKIDAQKCDPERLKAFNMFVRLFVDENLDRMVPISKQPKEKIQAIIDSCSRQFPEFSERSRKRIRTYLKSCRRTKRCRDQNGWDPGRPTPPHLTSAMAEQILATACDNESNNAKRMRLGLEPISVCVQNDRDGSDRLEPAIRQPTTLRAFSSSDLNRNGLSANGNLSYKVTSTGSPANSNCSSSPNHYSTGPADLSIKKEPTTPTSTQPPPPPGSQPPPPQPPAKCTLNPSEVSAVRQLIAGYRESAAFLVRSADELEQLLLQQN